MAVTLSGVSSSSGTLTAPGVGSGLDVKSLVSQLMAVEQRPLTLLDTQQAAFQAKLSGLGSVRGALSSLQTAAQSLVSASSAAYGASVSDSSVLTAAAASNAVAGSYAVAVTSLAQQQKLIAAGTTSTAAAIGGLGPTTLTFQLGTISGGTLVNGIYSPVATFTANPAKASVAVTIDGSNNTLAGIRDAINAANAGVTATIINDGSGLPYRLSLTSNDTGAASSLKLTVSGDSNISSLLSYDPSTATQNLSQTQAAQNAQFSVDGINITSATNSVSDAIQGVTLNLAKASPNPTPATATVTVQRDTSALTAALSALVQGYNSSNKAIASATAKGAALQGDWAVLGLQRQVRTLLGSTQPGGSYTTLSQLGVSFQKDGSLALDSTKLAAALSSSYADVASLTKSIASAINTAATSFLGTTGPLANETDGINRSIKDIGSRRIDIQSRLDAVQIRYQKQFSALDTLLSGMNSTSSFLTQQLANLPNYYNNKG